MLALCYGDPGRVSEEGFRHAVEEMERRQGLPYFWDAMARSARGIVDAYTVGGQHGLWRQAERGPAPTLLVYGGRDKLVGYRMAQGAAAFRDSRLLTLPDAGHVAMMEYPEAVAQAFRELLDASGGCRRGVGRHSRKGCGATCGRDSGGPAGESSGAVPGAGSGRGSRTAAGGMFAAGRGRAGPGPARAPQGGGGGRGGARGAGARAAAAGRGRRGR
ncbi:hypothetical protein SBADM41S_06805 [Streptomyces badius]